MRNKLIDSFISSAEKSWNGLMSSIVFSRAEKLDLNNGWSAYKKAVETKTYSEPQSVVFADITKLDDIINKYGWKFQKKKALTEFGKKIDEQYKKFVDQIMMRSFTNVWQNFASINLKLDEFSKVLKPIDESFSALNKATELAFGVTKIATKISEMISKIVGDFGTAEDDPYSKAMAKIASALDKIIDGMDIFSVHFLNLFDLENYYNVDEKKFNFITWEKFWEDIKWQTIEDEMDFARPLYDEDVPLHAVLILTYTQNPLVFTRLYSVLQRLFSEEYVTNLDLEKMATIIDKWPSHSGIKSMMFLGTQQRNEKFTLSFVDTIEHTYTREVIDEDGMLKRESVTRTYNYKICQVSYPENKLSRSVINSRLIGPTNFMWNDNGVGPQNRIDFEIYGVSRFENDGIYFISKDDKIIDPNMAPFVWYHKMEKTDDIKKSKLVLSIEDWPSVRGTLKGIMVEFMCDLSDWTNPSRKICLLAEPVPQKREKTHRIGGAMLTIPQGTSVKIEFNGDQDPIIVNLPPVSQSVPLTMYVDENGDTYYDPAFLVPISVRKESQYIEPNTDSIPPDYECLSLRDTFPILGAVQNFLYSLKNSIITMPANAKAAINQIIEMYDSEIAMLKRILEQVKALIDEIENIKSMFKQGGLYGLYAQGTGIEGLLDAIKNAKDRPQFEEGMYGGLLFIGQRGVSNLDLFAALLGLLGKKEWFDIDVDFDISDEIRAMEEEADNDNKELAELIEELMPLMPIELSPPESGVESGFDETVEESGMESGVESGIESGVESGEEPTDEDIRGYEI